MTRGARGGGGAPEWIREVKAAVNVITAAAALGLPVARGGIAQCPACGATRRSASDPRTPVGTGSDRATWHCWAKGCEQGGDVVDLVSWIRFGVKTGTPGSDAGALREACAALGWTRSTAGRSADPSVRRPRAPVVPHIAAARSAPASAPQSDPEPEGGAEGETQTEARKVLTDAEVVDLHVDSVAWLQDPEAEPVRDYLAGVRRIEDRSVREWALGGCRQDGRWWLVIPLRDASGRVVNLRRRLIPEPCPERAGASGCGRCEACAADVKRVGKYRVLPGRPLPLFGLDRLRAPEIVESVIVTEGELDVVALYQYGFESAVSGTAGADTFAEAWLDSLEPYPWFILAYDDDDKGNAGAEAIAAKLGRYRCARATLPRKDAGDCLADGVPVAQIEAALRRAPGFTRTEVALVGDLEEAVEAALEARDTLVGRPWPLGSFNDVHGGIRPGLVIVTGETGHGKTTALHWLLWAQAHNGVPGLITSFEQAEVPSAMKTLRAEVGNDPLAVSRADRAIAWDRLRRIPLHGVRHRGRMPWEEVEETIRYAVRRLGVRNVLIDHLGFITDPEAEDERREIERVVRPLSIFAEHEEITAFLVAHPNNQHVQQRRRVGVGDLKGASAIRQDAHEVWVIEQLPRTERRPWPATAWHFDKVRSDYGASASRVITAFDPVSTTYAERWEDTPSGRRGIKWAAPSAAAAPVPTPRRSASSGGSGGSGGSEAAPSRSRSRRAPPSGDDNDDNDNDAA